MRNIELITESGLCRIITGGGLKDVNDLIPEGKLAVITDRNVSRLYRDSFPPGLLIEIEPGEKSKTFETAGSVYEQLMEYELDRHDFIIGIGGGVICDLAGFIASTYLRGVRFGFVASTLLAQVDASIGGKNGVNLKGYKNIIGVIRQPEFIICDPVMLNTLEEKEFIGGLAEVIKYGAIMDKELFDFFLEHTPGILDRAPDLLDELVYRSAVNKVRLVEQDEFETGERTKLNFGHTAGHAIEKISGLTHGEAVAIGMNIAAGISVSEGLLNEKDAFILKKLILEVGLPVSIDLNPDDLFQAIRKDKKRKGDSVGFVLLEEIGSSVVSYMKLEKLKLILDDLYQHRK